MKRPFLYALLASASGVMLTCSNTSNVRAEDFKDVFKRHGEITRRELGDRDTKTTQELEREIKERQDSDRVIRESQKNDVRNFRRERDYGFGSQKQRD